MLLLVGIRRVVAAGLKSKFTLDLPRVLLDVVHVEVLVRIVPAHHVQETVVAEYVVRERPYFRQLRVPFHQVLFHVELEALRGAHCLVEAAENQDCFAIDRHAHREVAGCPGGLRVEVDHAPHVVVDVVHFNCVRDLFFIELGAARENIDVLVVEDATCRRVAGHVQVCDPRPRVVLDIVFFTRGVERLRVIASDHEDKAPLAVERREIRSLEEQR